MAPRKYLSGTGLVALALAGALAGGFLPPGHGGTPPGHGGVPPGHGGAPPGHGGVPPGQQQPAPDLGAINAFHTVQREQAELDGYTVYRPVDVAEDAQFPVVVWGNGACVESNISYIPFLTNVAKHGFVVIAVGAADAPVLPAPFPPPPVITGDALLAAVDWVTAESSPQLVNADPDRVATMGHSCGGTEALTASLDERVSSAVAWSSSSGPGVVDVDLIGSLRTPVMWVAGGETDHAHPRSIEAFQSVPDDVPAALVINEFASHGLFFGDVPGVGEPGRNMAAEGVELAVHWLDLTVGDNAGAADFFLPADSPLTRLEGWTVESANWGP